MTRRWHNQTNVALRDSLDLVADHQARVADLCHSLAARIGHKLTGSDLIHAALHHDAAEAVLGDMPAPVKDKFPKLAAAYVEAENQVLADMGLAWKLSEKEEAMLHICDKLDAYRWARQRGATGAEWEDARRKFFIFAKENLGSTAVDWLFEQLRGLE